MNKTNRITIIIVTIFIMTFLTGCDAIANRNNESGLIEASGIVEAVEVTASAEVSGKVKEILVTEGSSVEEGQPLLVLTNEILDAQYQQAIAALEVAEANLYSVEANMSVAEVSLESARIGLESASLQHEMILKQANLSEAPLRESAWDQEAPDEFELPSWYFSKDEEAQARDVEIQSAKEDLEIERANLLDVLENVSNADFREAEIRLANAQAAFLVAEELLDKDVEQNGRDAITDYVQSIYDSAEAELESAQKVYDSVLSSEKTKDVLEARARVEVATERYQTAIINSYSLQTGEYSLEVLSASLAVEQAMTFVKQAESHIGQIQAGIEVAEKNVEQADANLAMFEFQRAKLTVASPSSGVILSSTIEVGELVQAGMPMMVVGRLDSLSITVYLPEDIYGQVNLGDTANIQVDSYPGELFEAKVIKIADKAEFTPRNVQTDEDRRTTVFAIELSVSGDDGKLKPGMPADVSFLQ